MPAALSRIKTNHSKIIVIIIIITAAVSIAPYLTDNGEHTALYKINKNVYIETSKTIIL